MAPCRSGEKGRSATPRCGENPIGEDVGKYMAPCRSGLTDRSAKPRFMGSNPIGAYL